MGAQTQAKAFRALLLVLLMASFERATPFTTPFSLSPTSHACISRSASRLPLGSVTMVLGNVAKVAESLADTHTTFSQPGGDADIDQNKQIHRGPEALKTLYHGSSRILLVFFFKKDCSICHVFQPILERVVKEYSETESLHFVDLEVTGNPNPTKEAGVTAVPSMHIYLKGELIDVYRGVHCKRFLRNVFDTLMSKHGRSAAAKRWAADRISSARREKYFSSDIHTSILESQHAHFQHWRMPAWAASNIVKTNNLALGQVANRAGVLQNEDAELNKLRMMLPAFHVLPSIATPDPTSCVDGICSLGSGLDVLV